MSTCLSRRTFLGRTASLGAAALFSSIARAETPDAKTAAPLKTNIPLERLRAEVEPVIQRAMATHKVPGLSLALVRDGQTVWSQGFGLKNQETSAPVDDQTVHEAASLTKPVTAYAVLALCEQGRLDLDQPLAELLSEPYVPDESGFLKQITARHVLTHTTGLPNWLGPGKPARFLAKPGYRFGYSGEGFVYLQRVVEQLTELPLDALLQKQLFEPLEMSSASLTWRDEYEERLAPGYFPNAKRGLRRKQTQANAASSLVCTAADYARFVQRLLAGPTSAGLKLADAAQMWQPRVKAAEGVSWGLGIGVEHTPAGDAFWHWGNNASAYNCFVVGFPRQRTALVVMTNSGRGLQACTEIVPAVLGGDHPALRWSKVVG